MPQMTPERWQRVTALLDEVLPCDPSQRQTLLAGLCGDDDELRREVESLLRYEERLVSVLEEPLVPWSPGSPGSQSEGGEEPDETDETGLRIGPYRVLRRLGAGGMGTVYLAARENEFRKRVALKRIKRRALSEEVLFRFENERQILADLEHPNIARILDAGQTQDLLPYFAMEYVEGQPIDRYCDRHRLRVRQRIELVLEVCSALQLAHQNLVVHRDLKPGNILVTASGVPKLIDFGIAKHLEPDSVPHDVATRAGTQPMTLKYASPEQLWALPITTAADIYSLGVLIYQLLTGHDPYPFDAGLLAMHRSICEREPVKPSVAVTRSVEVRLSEDHSEQRTPESVSWKRGTGPGKLQNALAGDLDGILLKTLRKQPENRYRSVEQLADDLRRHLDGLPVSACEGTFRYLAGKFARRHAWSLAAVAAMLLLLVGSGVAMTALWARTEQARARAGRTAELLENVIEVFDPDEGGRQVTPLEFLSRAQRQITEDLQSEPELLADMLRGSLRRVYSRLGHHEEALASLDEALIILRTLHPGDHERTAEVLLNKGSTLHRLGDHGGAEQHWLAAFEMRQHLGMGGADLTVPLGNLAAARFRQGKLDEAARLYNEALGILQQDAGPDSPGSASPLRNLGILEFARGRPDEAEPLLQRALRIELEVHGPESSRVARLRSDLGRVLRAQGRLLEAERELMRAVEIRRLKLDADHIDVARAERNLAALMIEIGELATAEVLLNHAQQAFRRKSIRHQEAAGDWEMAEIESLLGELMVAQGRYPEAEPCLVESYRAIEAARGLNMIYTKQALGRVIQLYEGWGEPSLATEYRNLMETDQE